MAPTEPIPPNTANSFSLQIKHAKQTLFIIALSTTSVSDVLSQAATALRQFESAEEGKGVKEEDMALWRGEQVEDGSGPLETRGGTGLEGEKGGQWVFKMFENRADSLKKVGIAENETLFLSFKDEDGNFPAPVPEFPPLYDYEEGDDEMAT